MEAGSRFPLAHLNSELTGCILVPRPLTWFTTEEPVPRAYIFRGHHSLPGLAVGLQRTLL